MTLDVHPKWVTMHVNVVKYTFNIVIHMVIFSLL